MEDRVSLLLSTHGIVEDKGHNGMISSISCLFDGKKNYPISTIHNHSLIGHGGDDCVDFINNRFISTLVYSYFSSTSPLIS